MNLIIAGSRDFSAAFLMDHEVNIFLNDCKLPEGHPVTVISGTARGADQLGEEWALRYGHETVLMPAEWDKYGRSAGYKRNELMARHATHCIVFWDGQSKGSKHMIDIAQREGLCVRVVTYNRRQL